ncbi:MAG TPA: hypothetical protein VGH50_01855 [Candidatus Binatia bacterium]|jgi:hypothetical protein
MQTSPVETIKLAIVAATGLSKDTLHVYVGLATFVLAALILRKQARSIVPWLFVLAIAVLGEVVDMHEDLRILGYWRWLDSVHDIVNTLFWPTALLLLARFSKIFEMK